MLIKNEEKLFSFVKDELEEELGTWEGSQQQNSSANVNIATKLKSMFKTYEKNKSKFEESFFVFKGYTKKK